MYWLCQVPPSVLLSLTYKLMDKMFIPDRDRKVSFYKTCNSVFRIILILGVIAFILYGILFY